MQWQGVALLDSECHGPVAAGEVPEIVRGNVAELVLRIDEVVADIHVSVMLHDNVASAGLGICAGSRHSPDPAGQGSIEHAHEILAYVMPYPVIENVAEKAAVAHVADGPGPDTVAFPSRIDDGGADGLERLSAVILLISDFLHDGEELHIFAADGLEELVDFQSVTLGSLADGGQGVEFHAAVNQCPQAGHHPAE